MKRLRNTALVSILLPVYKSEKNISNCIKSLRSQTFKNFEVIAIDDNSSDNSYALLKAFAKKDKRIRAYKNKKRYGMAITLNRAAKRARGQFVAFMNHNDTSSKDRINQQVRFLLGNPKVGGVGTQSNYITKHGKQLGKSSFPQNHSEIQETLLPSLSIQPETVMLNKAVLPSDILKFTNNSYPLLYTEVFVKCIKYAAFANLPRAYYFHRKTNFTTPGKLDILPSLVKLVVKSRALYDYRPSLRSLFLPFLTGQTS